MSSPSSGQLNLVRTLATLLRDNGDSVLDGSSTLTLQVDCLQHLNRLFQQFLHSRTNQHGFLALPSHPADTPSMLQVQFLFDMLQKTISLKLINPPGPRLQSVVKIFPFKSLRYLELKRIPPHCLEGLRSVYSELQVFVCSRSVSSLQELLSLCGGDLSSALPWLELHTLNFSYNSISCLDESLRLLNVLRSLDLSHNRIQNCGEFLQPLSDLQHLNLGYNFLLRVPLLGLSCRATLVKLVLRNNELETINGVEQLCSLQHLDLAYNLLMEHSQLAPLSLLHNLNMLQLEGNPLYFHKDHRLSAVRHISPKAASRRFNLDGCLLSSCELEVLQRLGQVIGQITQTVSQSSMATEKGPQELSSGAGEMSDSLCLSEPAMKPLTRKKSRTKVRVRRASISEPSDTDHDLRTQSSLQDIVLHHQKDIERMETFRHQLGEDWLLYQHHLEKESKPQEYGGSDTHPSGVLNGCCATPPLQNVGLPENITEPPQVDQHALPLLTSEPKQEWLETELDTESTLRWPGHRTENTDSTLETSVGELQLTGESSAPCQKEEEEEELGVDLCLPLLVGVLSEGEGEEDQGLETTQGPLFLRVKPDHLLEVDMQSGRVLTNLELASLQEVTTSQATWKAKEEVRLPAVELHFSYINRTRRRRGYIMLDDNPEQMQQALADILFQVVEENRRRIPQGPQQAERMQCLKCCAEFSQQGEQEHWKLNHGSDVGQSEESIHDNNRTLLNCPECGSDHVVQLADQLVPSSSTPVLSEYEGNCHSAFDSSRGRRLQEPALEEACLTSGSPANTEAGLSDTFLTARSHTFYIGDGDGSSLTDKSSPTQLTGFQTPSAPGNEGLYASYNYTGSQPTQPTPPLQTEPLHVGGSNTAQFDLLAENADSVDHRLKLFLDVEVFEYDSEEFHCYIKMSAVKFGNPSEFLSLLVVSDQSMYFLEIIMEAEKQPSDLFVKRESHRISELSYLELGLGSQNIHMEFEDGSAYTLLVRDRARCKHFFGLLTEIVKELAPKSYSKLKSISNTRLNQQHHLWSLLCETDQSSVEDFQPHFLYVLAFIMLGGSLTPVTVLATRETLYLLNEDHQWRKSLPDATSSEDPSTCSGSVVIQETQPISCVSSVHLFASDPCRVNINIYDEVEKEEKPWVLLSGSAELTQALVNWVRTQWEAMFGVKLMTSLLETGS